MGEPDIERRKMCEDLPQSSHNIFRFIKMKNPFGDISRSEFFVLMYIFENCPPDGAGVKVSDLAKAQHMSFPALSKQLRTMELKGYIRRAHSETDRRVVYIHLSQKGYDCIKDGRIKAADRFQQLVSDLSDEEILQLTQLQNRLFVSMKAAVSRKRDED